jgi:hypothetical protein
MRYTDRRTFDQSGYCKNIVIMQIAYVHRSTSEMSLAENKPKVKMRLIMCTGFMVNWLRNTVNFVSVRVAHSWYWLPHFPLMFKLWYFLLKWKSFIWKFNTQVLNERNLNSWYLANRKFGTRNGPHYNWPHKTKLATHSKLKIYLYYGNFEGGAFQGVGLQPLACWDCGFEHL